MSDTADMFKKLAKGRLKPAQAKEETQTQEETKPQKETKTRACFKTITTG